MGSPDSPQLQARSQSLGPPCSIALRNLDARGASLTSSRWTRRVPAQGDRNHEACLALAYYSSPHCGRTAPGWTTKPPTPQPSRPGACCGRCGVTLGLETSLSAADIKKLVDLVAIILPSVSSGISDNLEFSRT